MCRMLNLTLCLLEWSYIVYLISIFSFDNNYVPQLVENSFIRGGCFRAIFSQRRKRFGDQSVNLKVLRWLVVTSLWSTSWGAASCSAPQSCSPRISSCRRWTAEAERSYFYCQVDTTYRSDLLWYFLFFLLVSSMFLIYWPLRTFHIT